MPANGNREARKAYQLMFRELESYQRTVGDYLWWYEYDETASSIDSVYTEGPVQSITFADTVGDETQIEAHNIPLSGEGNRFRGPVYVPAIWVRYIMPTSTQSKDGSYLISHLSARISAQEMRNLGLGHPLDPHSHMDDRLWYKGKLYRITEYSPAGWLRGAFLMVDIVAAQLKEADLFTDPFPFWEPPQPAWGQIAEQNWPYSPPSQMDS